MIVEQYLLVRRIGLGYRVDFRRRDVTARRGLFTLPPVYTVEVRSIVCLCVCLSVVSNYTSFVHVV